MFEKSSMCSTISLPRRVSIKERYASPATSGIMWVDGGLLVGAVMEQRPELFAVALLRRRDGHAALSQVLGGSAWAHRVLGIRRTIRRLFAYLSVLAAAQPEAGTCYPATPSHGRS